MEVRWYLHNIIIIVCILLSSCSSNSYIVNRLKPPIDKVLAQRHYEYGLSYLQQGQLIKADIAFTLAKKLNPKDPLIYLGLGRVLKKQGLLKLAAAVLQEGIRLNSNIPELYYNLGIVYTQLNRWPESILFTLFALEFRDFKQRPKALYNLALGYMGLKLWEPARYILEGILFAQPDFIQARWLLVLTLEKLGEWAESIRQGRVILLLGEKLSHKVDKHLMGRVNKQIALAYLQLGNFPMNKIFEERALYLTPGLYFSQEKQIK